MTKRCLKKTLIPTNTDTLMQGTEMKLQAQCHKPSHSQGQKKSVINSVK